MGSKEERLHQTYKVASKSALFLFRKGATIFKYGVAVEKTRNAELANLLWDVDDAGETWSTIYFFARIQDKIIPAARINEQLGRSAKDNWQGLVVLSMKDSEKVDEFFRKQLAGQ